MSHHNHLHVDGVGYAAGEQQILRQASLTVEHGRVTALIGPNGSGKTSLLRAAYRALSPHTGTVTVDGEDVARIPVRRFGRHLAVVTQENDTDFAFSADEVVALGRTPHKGLLDRDDAADRAMILDALAQVGMDGYEHRPFPSLSGGEKQRVLIARALAQHADLLVLDEPTNHLDIAHQIRVLRLLHRHRVSALVAVHDLNLAAAFADHLVLLDGGEVVAAGEPANVLTGHRVRAVFGVDADIVPHPRTGRPHLIYLDTAPAHTEEAAP